MPLPEETVFEMMQRYYPRIPVRSKVVTIRRAECQGMIADSRDLTGQGAQPCGNLAEACSNFCDSCRLEMGL